MNFRRVLAISSLVFSMIGCGAQLRATPGSPESNPPGGHPPGVDPGAGTPTLIFQDNFERADIGTGGPGWRGFIYDAGTPYVTFFRNHVGVRILDDLILGPAAEGTRAAYFHGRYDGCGYSFHEINLITPTFDLTGYGSVDFDFKYLTFQLENVAGNMDYFRMEVCIDTFENCGAGSVLDPTKLRDPIRWQSFWEHDRAIDALHYNGLNHDVADWRSTRVNLNLLLIGLETPYVFRFKAGMNSGFCRDTISRGLLDGAAIDDLKVYANPF